MPYIFKEDIYNGNGQYLLPLINHLLDLSKIEAIRLDFNLPDIDERNMIPVLKKQSGGDSPIVA